MPNHKVGQRRLSKAAKHYEPLLGRVLQLDSEGYSQPEIADIFNREGLRTLDGGPFHQVAVHRLIKRARKAKAQGKLTPTAAGAALAKQANIEARQPTPDERMATVAREEQAKRDEAFEMMKAYRLPDISGTN